MPFPPGVQQLRRIGAGSQNVAELIQIQAIAFLRTIFAAAVDAFHTARYLRQLLGLFGIGRRRESQGKQQQELPR